MVQVLCSPSVSNETIQMQNRILSEKTVCKQLGVSRVTLWRWENAGHMPRRRQIGPRRVGWLESELEAWLTSRPVTGEG